MLELVCPLILSLAPAPLALRDDLGAGEPAAPALQRVVVVGASASAGFQIIQEVGVVTNLADVLEGMIAAEHEPVLDASSSALFRAPLDIGEGRVEKALAAKPTLVFAVDFLFWFTYGSVRGEEERFPLLERGLAMLDRFECPLLVAEVPDMSPAIGKMLSRRQVPDPAVRARLNARIREWAGARERVVLVPLEKFVDGLRADEELSLRGYRVPAGSTRKLLQWDQLHPTLEGLSALAMLSMDALAEAHPELVPERALCWDPTEVARRVRVAKEPELRAAEEKRKEREERRKRREEEREHSSVR